MQDHWLGKDHVLQAVDQLNASASGKTHWLQNPIIQGVLQPILPKLLNKGNVLARQQEGLRNNVEELLDFPSQLLHVLNVLLEKVLPGDLFVADEVVDLLEEEEIGEVYLRL